jgi:hypothetical protein
MVWGMSILRGKGYEENDSVGPRASVVIKIIREKKRKLFIDKYIYSI